MSSIIRLLSKVKNRKLDSGLAPNPPPNSLLPMEYPTSTLPEKTPPSGIKSWAEEDRPREKLLLKGRQSLSDAELLAILIGSGNAKETAVDLCRRILKDCANDLHALGQKEVNDLIAFKGIGEAKAITIIAALELGLRRRLAEVRQRKQITSSRDAFDELQPLLGDLDHEQFWILLLNQANKIVSREQISAGGVTSTVADSKIIFKKAINALASSIILCHNHPSGSLKPSTADRELTRRLVESGKLLDIKIIDHLIVGIDPQSYYSFADEGLL